jgi:hypothetical protein
MSHATCHLSTLRSSPVFLVSGKPANLLGAVLGAMPDGLELQGLKVAKADFSAKPGTALRQPIIVSLLCGVSTVHDEVLACDERRTG